MEFSKDIGSATYRIKSYGSGYVTVNDENYRCPILILPEQLIAPWKVSTVAALTIEDFRAILQLQPQVLLIGTGFDEHKTRSTLVLSPALIQPLTDKGIGVEVMSSASACRTYTILMSEGRNVAAGLFI